MKFYAHLPHKRLADEGGRISQPVLRKPAEMPLMVAASA